MLNPVFSINNMRTLSSLIQPISAKLCLIFDSQFRDDGCKWRGDFWGFPSYD